MKIEFKDVGRERKSWTSEVRELTGDALYRAVRSKKALMSRDVDFTEEPGEDGWFSVIAGWRTVGKWRVVHELAQGATHD